MAALQGWECLAPVMAQLNALRGELDARCVPCVRLPCLFRESQLTPGLHAQHRRDASLQALRTENAQLQLQLQQAQNEQQRALDAAQQRLHEQQQRFDQQLSEAQVQAAAAEGRAEQQARQVQVLAEQLSKARSAGAEVQAQLRQLQEPAEAQAQPQTAADAAADPAGTLTAPQAAATGPWAGPGGVPGQHAALSTAAGPGHRRQSQCRQAGPATTQLPAVLISQPPLSPSQPPMRSFIVSHSPRHALTAPAPAGPATQRLPLRQQGQATPPPQPRLIHEQGQQAAVPYMPAPSTVDALTKDVVPETILLAPPWATGVDGGGAEVLGCQQQQQQGATVQAAVHLPCLQPPLVPAVARSLATPAPPPAAVMVGRGLIVSQACFSFDMAACGTSFDLAACGASPMLAGTSSEEEDLTQPTSPQVEEGRRQDGQHSEGEVLVGGVHHGQGEGERPGDGEAAVQPALQLPEPLSLPHDTPRVATGSGTAATPGAPAAPPAAPLSIAAPPTAGPEGTAAAAGPAAEAATAPPPPLLHNAVPIVQQTLGDGSSREAVCMDGVSGRLLPGGATAAGAALGQEGTTLASTAAVGGMAGAATVSLELEHAWGVGACKGAAAVKQDGAAAAAAAAAAAPAAVQVGSAPRLAEPVGPTATPALAPCTAALTQPQPATTAAPTPVPVTVQQPTTALQPSSAAARVVGRADAAAYVSVAATAAAPGRQQNDAAAVVIASQQLAAPGCAVPHAADTGQGRKDLAGQAQAEDGLPRHVNSGIVKGEGGQRGLAAARRPSVSAEEGGGDNFADVGTEERRKERRREKRRRRDDSVDRSKEGSRDGSRGEEEGEVRDGKRRRSRFASRERSVDTGGGDGQEEGDAAGCKLRTDSKAGADGAMGREGLRAEEQREVAREDGGVTGSRRNDQVLIDGSGKGDGEARGSKERGGAEGGKQRGRVEGGDEGGGGGSGDGRGRDGQHIKAGGSSMQHPSDETQPPSNDRDGKGGKGTSLGSEQRRRRQQEQRQQQDQRQQGQHCIAENLTPAPGDVGRGLAADGAAHVSRKAKPPAGPSAPLRQQPPSSRRASVEREQGLVNGAAAALGNEPQQAHAAAAATPAAVGLVAWEPTGSGAQAGNEHQLQVLGAAGGAGKRTGLAAGAQVTATQGSGGWPAWLKLPRQSQLQQRLEQEQGQAQQGQQQGGLQGEWVGDGPATAPVDQQGTGKQGTGKQGKQGKSKDGKQDGCKRRKHGQQGDEEWDLDQWGEAPALFERPREGHGTAAPQSQGLSRAAASLGPPQLPPKEKVANAAAAGAAPAPQPPSTAATGAAPAPQPRTSIAATSAAPAAVGSIRSAAGAGCASGVPLGSAAAPVGGGSASTAPQPTPRTLPYSAGTGKDAQARPASRVSAAAAPAATTTAAITRTTASVAATRAAAAAPGHTKASAPAAGAVAAAAAGATPAAPAAPAAPATAPYKYVEVVRKKDERQALPAHNCASCQAFYEALRSWGDAGAAQYLACGHVVAGERKEGRLRPSGAWVWVGKQRRVL